MHESISMAQIQVEDVSKTGSNSAAVRMFKYMGTNVSVVVYEYLCLFLRMYMSVGLGWWGTFRPNRHWDHHSALNY